MRCGTQLPLSPTARFLLCAQKKPGKENGSRGEGFLPDALPLHPFLLTLRPVRPHIWAGCTRPPPLPDAHLLYCVLECSRKFPQSRLCRDSSCCGARNSLFAIRSQNFVRVDTKHLRRTMFAQTQVSAQPLRSLASAAGGASLRPAATPFCSLALPGCR